MLLLMGGGLLDMWEGGGTRGVRGGLVPEISSLLA